jgi:polysaccharide pyruvyl transferase WcaK-like protein
VHDRLTLELQNRGVAPVQRIHYTNRPVEYLEVLASSGLCIAMRLHAAVFAYCVSTPAVVLSYHEKCDEWAAMIDQPAGAVVPAAGVAAEDLVAACGVAVSAPPKLEVGEAQALAKRNLTLAAEAIGRSV